ncbi:MAG: cytochrome-c oxidase, cbb3-type subunit III [Rhodobacter sp.]|uniref:cytochrome-c oxidase, cbb3-type subunit III n=1 Tax=Pararhodobacter sp. TaxID=2127056 RepID=UPI001D36415F|nr:cytochrome-c oxidase, cbb3-type subunit III [Pararhodobacter sp.]MCB1346833.1 cytochrome-c oxidase, cbb3-type subunit III [Paracoccaceae bacterium]MCB1410360.1 cytochrome-c oxidase, cbb3-type subunit III [Paracoccaceae bacterium]MCC0072925.1 cytochrome-c oxidase, cbb3-type subunit III [Rhodobacter sp.]HPD92391.1 cytochrome-c oxidase, cbb3-type subunit III [Pararhodobacter sp.]
MATPNKKQDQQTTGHSWDGIEEFDNPLPRWWLWIFYATILWSIVYWVLYPAWPMVSRATAGVLGYSSRADVDAEMATWDAENQVWYDRLVSTAPDQIAADPELQRFAVNAGAAVFRAQCSQCHGAGADGVRMGSGFPNLLDDEWMWGGTMDDIVQTVTYGIRNEDFPDTRYSEMPSFGRDQLLTEDQINEVVQHVLALSGQPHDNALATAGEQVFLDNCASCHGDNGAGDTFVGAPALNNAIWLYGGTEADIRATVTNAHFGIMPGFANRLPEAQIRAVAAYVHQLGGGQ